MKKVTGKASDYWQLSQRPLQALFFLLPLIALYEAGAFLWVRDQDIVARLLLRSLLHAFGATGYYLPGLIVIAVLLSWHFVRRDPFQFRPRLYALMWLESIGLALPLLAFMLILVQQPQLQAASWPLAGSAPAGEDWRSGLISSVGAGIYEELLFRLIGIALIHGLLVDVLGTPHRVGAALAIALTAVAFALYHFSPANPPTLTKLIFYTAAGVYFAGVYVLRGFGIVAGTHAAYDIVVVVLPLLGGSQQ